MRREEIVELRNLRKENIRLKKLVANQALDIDMLKDVARDAPIDRQVPRAA